MAVPRLLVFREIEAANDLAEPAPHEDETVVPMNIVFLRPIFAWRGTFWYDARTAYRKAVETEAMNEDQAPPPANAAGGLAPPEKWAEGQPLATRDAGGRFITGNNGGGRPVGSRNRLTDTFLSAIADDFAANGIDAIGRVREADPATYLKLVSSLVPRELVLQRERETDFSNMTIEEFADLLDRAQKNHAFRMMLASVRG